MDFFKVHYIIRKLKYCSGGFVMKQFSLKALTAVAAVSTTLAMGGNAIAKVEGDTIILGSSISLIIFTA